MAEIKNKIIILPLIKSEGSLRILAPISSDESKRFELSHFSFDSLPEAIKSLNKTTKSILHLSNAILLDEAADPPIYYLPYENLDHILKRCFDQTHESTWLFTDLKQLQDKSQSCLDTCLTKLDDALIKQPLLEKAKKNNNAHFSRSIKYSPTLFRYCLTSGHTAEQQETFQEEYAKLDPSVKPLKILIDEANNITGIADNGDTYIPANQAKGGSNPPLSPDSPVNILVKREAGMTIAPPPAAHTDEARKARKVKRNIMANFDFSDMGDENTKPAENIETSLEPPLKKQKTFQTTYIDTVDPIAKKLPAIKSPVIIAKAIITTRRLLAVEKHKKSHHGRRSCSQSSFFDNQSANVVKPTTLAEQIAEWLHLIAHMLLGDEAQNANNLVNGSYECNSQMTKIETELKRLALEHKRITVYAMSEMDDSSEKAVKYHHAKSIYLGVQVAPTEQPIIFHFNPLTEHMPPSNLHLAFRAAISAYRAPAKAALTAPPPSPLTSRTCMAY